VALSSSGIFTYPRPSAESQRRALDEDLIRQDSLDDSGSHSANVLVSSFGSANAASLAYLLSFMNTESTKPTWTSQHIMFGPEQCQLETHSSSEDH